MARVVFFSVDMHGHVNPTLGLVQKLVENGEEVLYFSGDPFREKIEKTGAVFKSYENLIHFTPREGDSLETLLTFAFFILDKNREIKDHFFEEIRLNKPDYIIHDAFCYWGREIAEMVGIPGVSVTANFPFIEEMNRFDPYFFARYVLRAENNPLYVKYGHSADISAKLLQKLSKSIALKYGIKNISVINDLFCSKENLNILFTSKEFQIHSEAFDESYYFAGYSINSETDQFDFSFELLDNRPLIYIAFGSLLDNLQELYQSCFIALGELDLQVVLSLGNYKGTLEKEKIPSNFIIKNWVPQIEILKRSKLFINHGGANSVYESITQNVPQIVIPQAFDEFMGALMVERSGVGIALEGLNPLPGTIRDAVLKILTDKSYQKNCENINNSFKKCGTLDGVVKKIFDYVKRNYIKV